MLSVNTGRGPIVFNAQVDVAAIRIGKAHHGLDQVPIRQPFSVAFELNRQRLGLWDRWVHNPKPTAGGCQTGSIQIRPVGLAHQGHITV